jgi:hypothetical protein
MVPKAELLQLLHYVEPETARRQYGYMTSYCGYDTIRHILVPDTTQFKLADSRMRLFFQQFLQQLLH